MTYPTWRDWTTNLKVEWINICLHLSVEWLNIIPTTESLRCQMHRLQTVTNLFSVLRGCTASFIWPALMNSFIQGYVWQYLIYFFLLTNPTCSWFCRTQFTGCDYITTDTGWFSLWVHACVNPQLKNSSQQMFTFTLVWQMANKTKTKLQRPSVWGKMKILVNLSICCFVLFFT